MARLGVPTILIAIAVHLCGCGGSDGGGSSQVATVNIEQNRFFPKNVTIKAGDRMTWVNTVDTVGQVVSGTLAATTSPRTRTPVISINQNNTFTPDTFEANLGDTVQWQNNRSAAFNMDIVNDAGVPQITLSFTRTGQIIALSSFPGAGFYTYQQQNNANFFGTLRVFGVPTPDGNFASQPLAKGGSFTTQFPTRGTFPYYSLNQDASSRSYITGTITVQ